MSGSVPTPQAGDECLPAGHAGAEWVYGWEDEDLEHSEWGLSATSQRQ